MADPDPLPAQTALLETIWNITNATGDAAAAARVAAFQDKDLVQAGALAATAAQCAAAVRDLTAALAQLRESFPAPAA